MPAAEERYVLDTSAIFALFGDEPGAAVVEESLRLAQKRKILLYGSFVTLAEIHYISSRRFGSEQADKLLALARSWPVEWVHSDEPLCLAAARIKASTPLSLADAFIAATAQIHQSTLIHRDPEFEPLSSLITLQPLPPKK
ncbi:MAG: type II toxin-antitoxin system VapC family toxin [Candidatus Methylacidiphilales bacterium]|nr:type II toxin-antitoxin system VapC family toxin [Candidatus Methylacidiphilales bacterium]